MTGVEVRARRIALWVNAISLVAFLALAAWIHLAPRAFSERVGDLVVVEVAERAEARLAGLAAEDADDGRLRGLMRRAAGAVAGRVDQAEALGRERLVPWVAAVVAGDPPPAPEGAVDRAKRAALVRIEPWVRDEAGQRLDGLRRSLTIFALTNAALLGCALLFAWLRPGLGRRLLPVSVSLSVATAVMSVWFVSGQDWLPALARNDFVLGGYAVFASFVVLLIIDLAFLKGRVSDAILRIVDAVIGTVANAFPG